MIEVSSKPIHTILRTAEANFGIDIPHLLESVSADTAVLSRGEGRLPWTLCCKVMERLEDSIGGREATKDFFDGHFEGMERKRLLGGLAGLFTDSRQLYRYAANVYAPGHFPNVECSLEIQSDGTLVLEARLPIEARDCPPFWWVTL